MQATSTATPAGAARTSWSLLKAARRRWHAHQAAAVLEAMDDAALKDIGVCRCNILRIIRDGCVDLRDL
jgi:uncharacterized protein YjiS (DUF1127 family)